MVVILKYNICSTYFMAIERIATLAIRSPKEFWELYKTLKDPEYRMDWEIRAKFLSRLRRTKYYKKYILEKEEKEEEEKIKKIIEEERKEAKLLLEEEII